MGDKATVDALSALHGAVATELTRRITTNEASAADIGAAIKFLKDNSITVSVEDDEKMQSLRDKLAERAKKRKLRLVGGTSAQAVTDEEADAIIAEVKQAV